MRRIPLTSFFTSRRAVPVVATLACLANAGGLAAMDRDDRDGDRDRDGDDVRLVVSRVAYGDTIIVGTSGPETFPLVFNDPNVSGIQGTIILDVFGTEAPGPRHATLALPSSGATPITTSFCSKSEGAVLRSADGRFLTYMGYNAAAGLTGVSNSYEAAPYDLQPPTSPNYNRAVARIAADGSVLVQPEANAFSGDNPRGAISVDGKQVYMAGNSDSPVYAAVPPSTSPTGPGTTIGARYGVFGSNSSFQLGFYTATDAGKKDKAVKDNNWRGLGIFNGNLYVSKGSGGNGDDGVFQVGTGLPTTAGQTITALFEVPATDPVTGDTSIYTPFGIWFADANTLYVADEGNPPATAPTGNTFPPDPYAGIEKWSLVGGHWVLDYTIQDGLDLGVGKMVGAFPVPTFTYGVRHLTGVRNEDGTVTLYAITAQFSAISGGEPDPTRLVKVSDRVDGLLLPAVQHELDHFVTLHESAYGEVYRGVAIAPEGFLRDEHGDRDDRRGRR